MLLFGSICLISLLSCQFNPNKMFIFLPTSDHNELSRRFGIPPLSRRILSSGGCHDHSISHSEQNTCIGKSTGGVHSRFSIEINIIQVRVIINLE